jgi:hypothetical protein
MRFTIREWWGLIHGMGLGALFLLAFTGGLADLYSLRPALITPRAWSSGCAASRSAWSPWPWSPG